MNKGKINLIILIVVLFLIVWQSIERRDISSKEKESIEKVSKLKLIDISKITISRDLSEWGDGRVLSQPIRVLDRTEISDFMNLLKSIEISKINHPKFRDTLFLQIETKEQFLLKVDFLHDQRKAYLQLVGVNGYYSSEDIYQFFLKMRIIPNS